MKFRIYWVPVLVLLLVAAGYWAKRQLQPAAPARQAAPAVRRTIQPPPPVFPPVAATAPTLVVPKPQIQLPAPPRLAPEMVIPIQDRATIDFSIGAPIIRSGDADSEALEKALKQMEEATRSISFPPPKTEPAASSR